MKKLVFGFSTTDYLLSQGIRFVQGLDVSHCYLQFDDDRYQETLIYEAKGLSTHIVNRLSVHDEDIKYEYEVEVTEEVFNSIMKDIHHEIGTPYGWKEILGYAIKWFVGLFFIKIRNPFPTEGKVCSEACGRLIVKYFGEKADVNTGDMDVKWLLGKFQNNPKFKQIKG